MPLDFLTLGADTAIRDTLYDDFIDWNNAAFALDMLPEARPRFHVASLSDKPQNPIIEALDVLYHAPKSGDIHPHVAAYNPGVAKFDDIPHAWDLGTLVQLPNDRERTRFLSWDALRIRSAAASTYPALLSELPTRQLSAVRHHIHPLLQDPHTYVKYTAVPELIESLALVLTGSSSALYKWDPRSNSFILQGDTKGRKGLLLLVGSDDTISESLLRRFLTIGTTVRQLEAFLDRRMTAGSIFHAFTSSASSVLQYAMEFIRDLSPLTKINSPTDVHQSLTAWWACFADLESFLLELFGLCNYCHKLSLNSQSRAETDLLSHIYDKLDSHIGHSSSTTIRAFFAFILTTVSRVYFKQLSASVGFTLPSQEMALVMVSNMRDQDDQDNDSNDRSRPTVTAPSFFSESMRRSIGVAQRSLDLLMVANPAHPLLAIDKLTSAIDWVWTDETVYSMLDNQSFDCPSLSLPPLLNADTYDQRSYPDALHGFHDFDLEPNNPGTHSLGAIRSSALQFKTFLGAFPTVLPSITPTLHLLSKAVTGPLFTHIDSVSKALIDVFLSPCTQYHLPTHLQLLKSYLLLTSSAFKMHLEQALFSSEQRLRGGHTMSESHRVIGLSPKLTVDGTWPPAGSSLSLSLRTVILDALAQDFAKIYSAAEESIQGIHRDAEWRIGFAIQDLPTNAGNALWLNPRAIQAFDFLYLDYQPPKPLDSVITPLILSKYHRIFLFCLRLMRVDNVIYTLSYHAKALQVLLSDSRATLQLFLHFKFLAKLFITGLSNYIYTHAIGAIYDRFLADLAKEYTFAEDIKTFTDVDALMQHHSAILDNILVACLLRSGQKSIAKYLHNVMEIILEFGLLIDEYQMQKISKPDMTVKLEELFNLFHIKMNTLTKILKQITMKLEFSRSEEKTSMITLLLCLDPTGWWCER